MGLECETPSCLDDSLLLEAEYGGFRGIGKKNRY